MSVLIDFKYLFNLDLSQLRNLNSSQFENSNVELYSEILTNYLSHDLNRLKRLVSIAESRQHLNDDSKFIYRCAYLRLSIREFSITKEKIKYLEEVLDSKSVWYAEMCFILGYASDKFNDNEKSLIFFKKAYNKFNEMGLYKKAIRSLANSIAAKSRIDTDLNCISDLTYLLSESIKYNEFITANRTSIHLSREYLKLGCVQLAFKFANSAINYAQENIGTIDYYEAYLNRCHIYAELGFYRDSRLDYQIIIASRFESTQSSMLNILKKFPQLTENLMPISYNKPQNSMFWSESQISFNINSVGDLAEKIIEFLASGPKSKTEICHYLYGDKIETTSAEARLSNVLTRLKKQNNKLFAYTNGFFHLIEEPITQSKVSNE